MNRILSLLIVALAVLLSFFSRGVFAAGVDLAPFSEIRDASITVDTGTSADPGTMAQSFGLKILAIIKVAVSGFALVFMVMIGAYMVIFSENEERVKTQKRQIYYALIAFLFLNVPGILIDVMSPQNASSISVGGTSWIDGLQSVWYWDGLSPFVASILSFLRVFAYGIALLMLTWGFFRLIFSAGDEEVVKSAKTRVIYSVLGLVFLFFVDTWASVVMDTNIIRSLAGTVGRVFQLAIFFAGPFAVFFLIYGAYYYITSAGDEERIKKGKNILINTFIAAMILIAAFSFLSDIVAFTL